MRVTQDESLEEALRRFKKACENSGVQSDVRRHEQFKKPSECRKRKLNAAKRRVRQIVRPRNRKAS